MQSFIMNSHEVFIHIHQGCFAGTEAIVRLPQCQWSKPDGYGKISQCITTTKHRKAKTVCIFLGIYCNLLFYIKNMGMIKRLLYHVSNTNIIPYRNIIWLICRKELLANFKMTPDQAANDQIMSYAMLITKNIFGNEFYWIMITIKRWYAQLGYL